jgi:hypothetical protein
MHQAAVYICIGSINKQDHRGNKERRTKRSNDRHRRSRGSQRSAGDGETRDRCGEQPTDGARGTQKTSLDTVPVSRLLSAPLYRGEQVELYLYRMLLTFCEDLVVVVDTMNQRNANKYLF